MTAVALSATGVFTPEQTISNDELAAAFNAYAARFNEANAAAIEAGAAPAIEAARAAFMERASGVRARYVMNKAGVLDPARMAPDLPARPDSALSLSAEIGAAAAKQALERAGRSAKQVDAVICAASNMQRPYPSIAAEIQHALGIDGFAFDMNAAAASAAFAIVTAADYVRAGHARSVLAVNPEINSAHVNWRDRASHFIFGDAASAVLIEHGELAPPGAWAILGARLKTSFSNNIRNNFGFLNRCAGETAEGPDKFYVQDGRKVFAEMSALVSDAALAHMADLKIDAGGLKRLWLHQSNSDLNRRIAHRGFGRETNAADCPDIMGEYANTGAAGCIIAFHQHSADLQPGDKGMICAYGAGYAVGSVLLQKAG